MTGGLLAATGVSFEHASATPSAIKSRTEGSQRKTRQAGSYAVANCKKVISSLDDLTSYGQIHLGGRGEIGADQIYVAQLHGTVLVFGVQEIEQGCAAVLVGKLHGVAHANGLFQILALIGFQKIDVAGDGCVCGVHVAVDLGLDALAKLFVAVDVDLRAQFLALIAYRRCAAEC